MTEEDRYLDEIVDEFGELLDQRDGFVWCTDCRVWVRASTTEGHDQWHVEQSAHDDPNQEAMF